MTFTISVMEHFQDLHSQATLSTFHFKYLYSEGYMIIPGFESTFLDVQALVQNWICRCCDKEKYKQRQSHVIALASLSAALKRPAVRHLAQQPVPAYWYGNKGRWTLNRVFSIIIALEEGHQPQYLVKPPELQNKCVYWTQVYLGSDLWVRVSLTNSQRFCRHYWVDSGWWRYQLNTNW